MKTRTEAIEGFVVQTLSAFMMAWLGEIVWERCGVRWLVNGPAQDFWLSAFVAFYIISALLAWTEEDGQ